MSALGRIALGVVGALIGAPFGLSAIGFSIGSAIGGLVFAPDGPSTEGPRLGDTNVSSSSLGKVLPENYGVTRVSGNMIWSAGLKEVKTTTEQGGKGGGGATVTSYTYFASYAMALGRGNGKILRRIWADGKLIYDITGESETNNDKYKFRFYTGSQTQSVDPLIKDSIHRRLAGLPDVNEGNQEQKEYTTIDDLIASAAETGARGELYARLLWERKVAAEEPMENYVPPTDPTYGWFLVNALLGSQIFGNLVAPASGKYSGPIPDYRFAPAYRGICYIVFDNMPLEDFGNRIPNITAEVVWEGATLSEGMGMGDGSEVSEVRVVDVPEIGSTPQPVPGGVFGVDPENDRLTVFGNGLLRRFDLATKTETARKALPDTFALTRVLGATMDGNLFCSGKVDVNPAVAGSGTNSVFLVNGGTLVPSKINQFTVGTSTIPFFSLGTLPTYGAAVPIKETVPTTFDTNGGTHFAFGVGRTIAVYRIGNGSVRATASIEANPTSSNTPNNGPVVTGEFVEKGVGDILAAYYGGTRISITKITVTNSAIKNGFVKSGENEITLTKTHAYFGNPFGENVESIAALVRDTATGDTVVLANLVSGKTGVLRIDAENAFTFAVLGAGTAEYAKKIDFTAPTMLSGLSRSDISNGRLSFGAGTSIVSINLNDGTATEFPNVAPGGVSRDAQLYVGSIGAVLAWEASDAKLFYVYRDASSQQDSGYGDSLRDVIADVCRRSGMQPDEYDVSGVSYTHVVRGYTVARPSTGRQVLDNLLQAYFVDGVESDWKVVFKDRSITPVRTIYEDELGEVRGPTGPVNWLETRTPEFELPSEINLNYADLLRDYQNGSAHKRRISNPVPAMYSDAVQNIELPLVMKDYEAEAVAERLLFLSWMSRDSAKTTFNWKHVDLDPGDVVSVVFKDGRTVTDRLAKMTLGANFEIDVNSVRSGDPVYTAAPQTIIPTGAVPTQGISTPVKSDPYIFDIPLLYDYHDMNRLSSRYYAVVATESPRWRSATIFQSWDDLTFGGIQPVELDVTWGRIEDAVAEPRALWTTDTVTQIRVTLAQDNGDVVSVTFDQMLSGANRALIWNPETSIGEIIHFQTATVDTDGSIILSNLLRGTRGTDYAVDKHSPNALFFLLADSNVKVLSNELERLNSTGYFKAVSAGQLITAASSKAVTFTGKDLMPWAPSGVNRTTVGSDLKITWNRRTRVGGGWTMSTVETVPLSEDSERYEVYLLAPGSAGRDAFDPRIATTYSAMATVYAPEHTFTAAQLTAGGYTLADPVNVAVYQVSAQVGRGFPRILPLAP